MGTTTRALDVRSLGDGIGILDSAIRALHCTAAPVVLVGMLGLLGLSAAVAAPHERMGEKGERVVTAGPAGLLIAAHLRNFQRCRADRRHHGRVSRAA